MRQDVRRELGHGHEADRGLSELQRLADRLESGELGGREVVREAEAHWSAANNVADALEREDMGRTADYVIEEAREHHPDRYRDYGSSITGGL
jgi:hypothetical protein